MPFFKNPFRYKNESEQLSENDDNFTATRSLSIKQRFLKKFHSPVTFTIVSFIAFVLGTANNGYHSAIVSTLEKRFQLTNKEIGLLTTIYDIFALTSVVFVTHYGQSRHRPRVIGTLHFLNGLAFLVSSLPHFIYPVPDFIFDPTITNTSTSNDICVLHDIAEDQCATPQDNQGGIITGQVGWLLLGSLLASFGSGLLALTIPYIDDGVRKNATAIYAAFLLCSYSIGGMMGYFLASVCLSVPAYPTLVNHQGYPKSPSDANWLGAWWLGYLIEAFLLMLISPVFFFFPKYLPKPLPKPEVVPDAVDEMQREDKGEEGVMTVSHQIQEEIPPDVTSESTPSSDSKVEVKQVKTLTKGLRLYFASLVKSLRRILTNIPILCLCLVGPLHMASFAGLQLFGALYMQYQFNLQSRFTALLYGLLNIPSGVFGNFVGGYFVKRFGKTRLNLALLLTMFTAVAFSFDPIFVLLSCPTARIAGVNENYNYSGSSDLPHPSVNVSCNSDCDCKVEAYDPVCGSDGLTYVSPCFAGCTVNSTILEHGVNETIYSNCSCIAYDNSTFIGGNGTAISGECRPFCATTFRWFFTLGLMWSACMTLMAIPALMLSLRCVANEDRALTMTVANISSKVLGNIPAPVVFGAMIDAWCLLFQSSCDNRGSCLVYNNTGMRWSLYGTVMCLHFLALVFTVIATLVIFYQDRFKKSVSSGLVLSTREEEGYRKLEQDDKQD